jgi:ParB-like nuclease domain
MSTQNRPPVDAGDRGSGNSQADKLSPRDCLQQNEKQVTSTWRDTYKVHPAADVFPMMSEEDLDKLGDDIKANGLRNPIILDSHGSLLDGRNRLEAMERAAIDLKSRNRVTILGDPVAEIVAQNIRRRHLTKEQQADLIVAAHKAAAEAADKPRQLGEVSAKSRRAKVNTTKAAAVATAKEHGISKRTVERSFAKVERRIPEPKKIAGPRPRRKPKLETHVGIDAARRYYLEQCAEPDVDLDAEQEIIIDALHEIAGKRAMQAADDDLGNIPAGLDRRRRCT